MLLLLLECDCRRRNATILSNNFNRVENFGKEKLNGRVITGCVEGGELLPLPAWCFNSYEECARGIGAGTNFTQGKFLAGSRLKRALLDGYWIGVGVWAAVSTSLVDSMEWAKWKYEQDHLIVPATARCDHVVVITAHSFRLPRARSSSTLLPPPPSCWWFVRDSGFE